MLSSKLNGLLYHYDQVNSEVILIGYGNNLFLEFIYPENPSKPNKISESIP